MGWFWIALGGAIGAMSRFGVSQAAAKAFGTTFPLGTLLANLTGCFLIGMLMVNETIAKNESLRLGVGVGFLGALTTFSTFGAETIKHWQEDQSLVAFSNVVANVVLGLLCVYLGMIVAKKLWG